MPRTAPSQRSTIWAARSGQHDLAEAKQELRLDLEAVTAQVLVLQWMTGVIVTGMLALVAKAFF